MRLPDKRYTATLEHCGYESPLYVARFCDQWLKDSALWPERNGNAAPQETRNAAIALCIQYESARRELISIGVKQNATISFLED